MELRSEIETKGSPKFVDFFYCDIKTGVVCICGYSTARHTKNGVAVVQCLKYVSQVLAYFSKCYIVLLSNVLQ